MSSTVRRVGPVLDLFTIERPEWTAAEIAEAVGVPRSTGHTLVVSLAELGLLRLGPRGRYRVGWRALELDGISSVSSNLLRFAAPVLEALSERSGESVNLAVLSGRRALYVDVVPGARAVAVVPPVVGRRCGLGSTAVGRVLLSGMSTSDARTLLHEVSAHAGASSGLTAVAAEVERIRFAGVGFAVEDDEESLGGIAAPVVDGAGEMIAALGLLVPLERFESGRDRLAACVRAAADRISARIVR